MSFLSVGSRPDVEHWLRGRFQFSNSNPVWDTVRLAVRRTVHGAWHCDTGKRDHQMPAHSAMEVRGSISSLLEFRDYFLVGIFFSLLVLFLRAGIRSLSLIG